MSCPRGADSAGRRSDLVNAVEPTDREPERAADLRVRREIGSAARQKPVLLGLGVLPMVFGAPLGEIGVGRDVLLWSSAPGLLTVRTNIVSM
jgi:hypothetical protein